MVVESGDISERHLKQVAMPGFADLNAPKMILDHSKTLSKNYVVSERLEMMKSILKAMATITNP